MKKASEYRLICRGFFPDVNAARHALHEPFIEEFVEETGKFRFHNLNDIRLTGGVSLADLTIIQLDEDSFEISCRDSHTILNRQKAWKLAEVLRRQAIFDEISIEALEDG